MHQLERRLVKILKVAERQARQVVFKQSERTGLIEDPEAHCPAHAIGIFGDQFQAEGMKRSDPHFNRGVGIHGRQAFAHLLCGLVGKRQCENGRRGRTILKQMADAMDEGSRLAGARPGIDEQRSLIPCRCFHLAVIKRVGLGLRLLRRRGDWRQKKRTNGLVHDKARRQSQLFGNFSWSPTSTRQLFPEPIGRTKELASEHIRLHFFALTW
ncbi:hypothetical protein AUC68_05190 [Methyloceanibacter methanicus]|uniref:Uncharacterized protein n=1 Tax=Methyloceanibacter methanicus TaxID=1774968 RepID=A0A1E3W0P4_9HYPH|nr:hypothetical protein AUC68_05190 [Methyloceanibacter methanicus]